MGWEDDVLKENDAVLTAQGHIKECLGDLANCESVIRQFQFQKEELQKEVDRLNEVAEKAHMDVLKSEEEVA